MEIREVEEVTAQTGEIFYLGDDRSYWYNVYIKERPELSTHQKFRNIDQRYRDPYINVGPNLTKAIFLDRESCSTHQYDYVETLLEKTSGKIFYIYDFNNDIYFIQEEYINKYKQFIGLNFQKKTTIMFDMIYFVKLDEGFYRAPKNEFSIFVGSQYIYIVNLDGLNEWKKYKETFHPQERFNLKHVFGNPRVKSKWSVSYQPTLKPVYSDDEVIVISNNIYRTRNIIPEKVSKKYSPQATWQIDPLEVHNKEDYIFRTPEFLCFYTLFEDEYLVNVDYIEDWHKLIIDDKLKYSTNFIYNKFLFSVQPYEYKIIQRGIYIRTKPVDPYLDSPPK